MHRNCGKFKIIQLLTIQLFNISKKGGNQIDIKERASVRVARLELVISAPPPPSIGACIVSVSIKQSKRASAVVAAVVVIYAPALFTGRILPLRICSSVSC